MKQNLQLKMSQSLALTPQLQQSIRLLQLSSLELNQELETILVENPLLELVDGQDEYNNDAEEVTATTDDSSSDKHDGLEDEKVAESAPLEQQEISNPTPEDAITAETPISDDDFKKNDFDDDYEEYGSASSWDEARKQNNNNGDDDDENFTRQQIVAESLREHLISQLKLLILSDRDQKLILLLIDSINENGYLEASLEEILEALPLELEVELVELETVLKHVQNLDPPGIGASNLQECILLQLNILPDDIPSLTIAKTIAKEYLQLLANKDFNKLRKLLNCNEEVLKSAQTLIKLQNPRPGADFAQFSPGHFIQHEIIVKKVKGIWVATLNDGVMPKLRSINCTPIF